MKKLGSEYGCCVSTVSGGNVCESKITCMGDIAIRTLDSFSVANIIHPNGIHKLCAVQGIHQD